MKKTGEGPLIDNDNPEWEKSLNPNLLNALQDTSKIKEKIFIPKQQGVNYIGLLLGPRGVY
jgi:hypothetical protein